MVAARRGHFQIAHYLLRMGADIHAIDGVSESNYGLLLVPSSRDDAFS